MADKPWSGQADSVDFKLTDEILLLRVGTNPKAKGSYVVTLMNNNLDGAKVKAAYEAQVNAFTDALFTKLAGIEANATADQTGAEIKTAYEAEVNAFTDALFTKLAGIEANATADQTGAEIKTAYEAEVKAFTDAQFDKLAAIEANATADQTGAEIKTAYEAEVNAFTDALFTKLAGIEANATADQTGAEIKTAYEAEVNAFTDALFTKLAGIEAGAQVNTVDLGVAQEWTKAQNFNATSLVALGADLVTNGGFGADTDWTKGTGWSIGSGVASSDGTQAGDADLTQALSLVNGQTYEVEFTISNYSAGNATPVAGDVEGTDRAANGTFTENIVAGAGGDIDIRADLDFIGDIDNVIVRLANVSWNLDDNQVTVLTLDGDLVIDNPTNLKAGGTYILYLVQDATGTRVPTFGSAYKFPDGIAPTLSTAANAVDIIAFTSRNGTTIDGSFRGDYK